MNGGGKVDVIFVLSLLVVFQAAVHAQSPQPVATVIDNTIRYAAPVITDDNFVDWMAFIEPSDEEMKWFTEGRWHGSLSAASKEAKALNRPILLWAMNGHPSGET
ncbi:MAG: hypothetical protein AAF226_19770 [Verrucomicrobiota bacterium]